MLFIPLKKYSFLKAGSYHRELDFMIEGIGVDIVEVDRIKAVYEKFGDKFLNRLFTEREIKYSFLSSNPFPHLSARFAAKEAVIKALKKTNGLKFTDIEVLNNEEGIPNLIVKGIRKKFFVSLSHEKKYAVAFVVVLSNETLE